MPRRRPAVEQAILDRIEQDAHAAIVAEEDALIFQGIDNYAADDGVRYEENGMVVPQYPVRYLQENIAAAREIVGEQPAAPGLPADPALLYDELGNVVAAPLAGIQVNHNFVNHFNMAFNNAVHYYGSATSQIKEPMKFEQLDASARVAYVKREFASLMKDLFERPEKLKELASQNKISTKDAKLLFKAINTLNHNKCTCCRTYDSSKLQLSPIPQEFESLLDIALTTAKTKAY